MKKVTILLTFTVLWVIPTIDAIAALPTPSGTVAAIASSAPTGTVAAVPSSTPTPLGEGQIIISPPIKPRKPMRPLPDIRTPRPIITVAATAIPTVVPTPGEMVQAARAGLEAHKQNFGIEDVDRELKIGRIRAVEEDPFFKKPGYYARAKGSVSFRQRLPDPTTGNELEVADTEMRVWVNRINQPTNIKGTFFRDLAVVAEETRITQDLAQRLAVEQFRFLFPGLTPKILSSSMKIFAPRVYMTWERNPDPMGYKAWVIHIISEPPANGNLSRDVPANEIFYISAFDGHLLWHTTNVRGINRIIWDCSLGMCLYGQDQWYNGGYYHFGRVEGQDPVGPNPVYGGTDTDDVYQWFAGADQFALERFGRAGSNSLGGTGDNSHVPYTTSQGQVYMDPFWGESCPYDARYTGYDIRFCSDAAFLDVFGHEYAHGFTHFAHWEGGYPVGMLYEGESGALDESQADVFGVIFEQSQQTVPPLDPTPTPRWLMPGHTEPSWRRDLADPPSLNDARLGEIAFPDRFHHEGFYCGPLDNGGVHHNSTVLSKAVYLLTFRQAGDPPPPNQFNGCQIDPIPQSDVEQIIYRAVTQYYSRTENFNQAYLSLRFACDDLFPPPSGYLMHSNCIELAKALSAVQMNVEGRCWRVEPSTPPRCAESEIGPTCNNGGCGS